jgi:alkylation response protein AidB-like acyl-CoA dehydrogenase
LKAFLAREVTPFADRWEKEGIVPREVWRRMGRAGFLCPWVSPQYGGLGGDYLYSVIVTEELSHTRQTGLAAGLHSDVVVPYIDAYGSPEIKSRYLPGCVSGDVVTAVAMTEPGHGSDLAGMRTTAVETADGIVLDGSKTFISNGIVSELVVVAARNPEIENPYEGISLYLVESGTPGFKRGRRLEKMGWHSQDTAELFFSGCRIPPRNRLGAKGAGFLMLMEKLQPERLMAAVGAVAGAERILEGITAHCRDSVVSGRPLVKSQAVRFALVEMATDVKLGRTFLDKLIADHMAGETVIVETAMAKYWTTEMVKRVADRALDLMGPDALRDGHPLVRGWRDVRVMSIFAGTNEIMKEVASRFMGL